MEGVLRMEKLRLEKEKLELQKAISEANVKKETAAKKGE